MGASRLTSGETLSSCARGAVYNVPAAFQYVLLSHVHQCAQLKGYVVYYLLRKL